MTDAVTCPHCGRGARLVLTEPPGREPVLRLVCGKCPQRNSLARPRPTAGGVGGPKVWAARG